ncbi:glutathione S-transferase, N-terminal domain protein [Leptospira fainei serovar Hurstbridge str. BUT 6]|uniref:Glutathione S-transferase, N-terminal domain protein n=1 Tax=Leptospira fainei serovar Hurstbridge str. BUT 6 TaxID=1193011 RepID=S3W4Z5_9LEPT|nr:glutathione S-transferase N-terminal domain-containing protein [Leptospira fainei]EPG75332.1 glutathione S-transferase, N-terminal domain protein [Leptospira fainei serovar Hurstbridge str. BUT 6]
MELLYTKTSPFARKVRIFAIEKELPLKLIEENPYEKRPSLLEKNPAGKIPVLLRENGKPLIDSSVICEYIDLLNDTPILIPRNGEDRFEVLHRAAVADAMLEAGLALYVEKNNHGEGINQKFQRNKELAVETSLQFFEDRIDDLKTFQYDNVSLICALGSLAFRIPELVDYSKFPKLEKWAREMSRRKSVLETVPEIG